MNQRDITIYMGLRRMVRFRKWTSDRLRFAKQVDRPEERPASIQTRLRKKTANPKLFKEERLCSHRIFAYVETP